MALPNEWQTLGMQEQRDSPCAGGQDVHKAGAPTVAGLSTPPASGELWAISQASPELLVSMLASAVPWRGDSQMVTPAPLSPTILLLLPLQGPRGS